MRVYLVRHAHAGDREDWKGDDRARPLTGKGRRQAQGLVRLLGDTGVERVLSSPFLRCVQTVEPLALELGRAVETDPRLAEGSSRRQVIELAAAVGAPSVLCSQGDVIGDVINDLVARSLVSPGDARAQKGSTWVLDLEGGVVQAARYLPPPADG